MVVKRPILGGKAKFKPLQNCPFGNGSIETDFNLICKLFFIVSDLF